MQDDAFGDPGLKAGRPRGWLTPAAGRILWNWVCFARWPLPGTPSSQTSHPAQVWLCLAQSGLLGAVRLVEIGFVLHDWLPDVARAAPNWLCLARFGPKLGLFRTTGPRLFVGWASPPDTVWGAIGFVSRSGASRRCRTIGSARPGAACGKLGLFLMIHSGQLGLFVQPARAGLRRQAQGVSRRKSVPNPQFICPASSYLFLPLSDRKS